MKKLTKNQWAKFYITKEGSTEAALIYLNRTLKNLCSESAHTSAAQIKFYAEIAIILRKELPEYNGENKAKAMTF